MKRITLALTALLALTVYAQDTEPAVPADEEDPYVLLAGQADKAVADGDFEAAAQRLLEAMALRPEAPNNVLLMSNLGMIYSYLDRDSLALTVLDEAVRRAPALMTAQQNRAEVLLKLGRDKEAFDAFTKVIAADSVNTDARYYHGMLALYGGKLDTAEADFAVLKRLVPESLATARALGTLYSLSGRDREAIPHLQKLISYEPAAEYYASLAGCQLALAQLSEASATIAEGLEKYPDDPELYYYRAILNRDRFRLDDAHHDADRAVRLGLNPARAAAIFAK